LPFCFYLITIRLKKFEYRPIQAVMLEFINRYINMQQIARTVRSCLVEELKAVIQTSRLIG